MSTIGHNRGPSMERGAGFRRTAWAHARRALLPTLPLQVIRRRVARAEALGLPYRTYAAIRSATGEDITAFLFSSNALRLLRESDRLSQAHSAKLVAIDAERHALLAKGIPAAALAPVPFASNRPQPPFTAAWSALKADMQAWLRAQSLPRDKVVMVGDTAFEREHFTAGRLAAFLPAAQYFQEPRA